MHIDKLALEAEKGANAGGGKAIVFNTITISDGISMGSEGMKYSLVSREVIADSIEIPKAFGTAAAWTATPSPLWGEGGRRSDEVRRTDHSFRADHDEFFWS